MNQKKINQKNLKIFECLQELTKISEEKIQKIDLNMAEIEKSINLKSKNNEESELTTILF